MYVGYIFKQHSTAFLSSLSLKFGNSNTHICLCVCEFVRMGMDLAENNIFVSVYTTVSVLHFLLNCFLYEEVLDVNTTSIKRARSNKYGHIPRQVVLETLPHLGC